MRGHRAAYRFALWAACMMLHAVSFAQEETAEVKEPEPKYPWLSGTFESNLWLERTDRDGNILLDQILRLNIDPPQKERFHLRTGIWAIEDIDGHEDTTSTLAGLHNTYEASVQVRLLHLYAEWDDVWGESTLRVGRQRVLENPVYPRIDGLYFSRHEPRWDWYVFGGARASLYESSYDDATLGGGVTWHATARTRLSIDAFYGEEDRRRGEEVYRGPIVNFLRLPFPRRVRREIDSRMFAATINHQWRPSHYAFGRYTVYDGESDEFLLTATGVFIESEIAYDVTFRRRENTLGDRVNELTGFFRVIGEQNEFNEVFATVHLPLFEKWTTSLDAQFRQTESDDPETANRDFQRYAVTFSGENVWRGIDPSLNLEYWDVSGGESSFAVTGDLTKAWGDWEATVGADFARWEDRIVEYRPLAYAGTRAVGRGLPFVRRFASLIAGFFDTEVVETHENIYSVFGEVDYAIDDAQSVRGRIVWEEDDGPDSPYWSARLTYRVRF